MLKNNKDRFVMFEKCFSYERMLFKESKILWDDEEFYEASILMRKAFPTMGLFFIKRHLENDPIYPRDFEVIRKYYLE